MMKKHKIINLFVLGLIFLLGGCCVTRQTNPPESDVVSSGQKPYFIQVPIAKLSSIQAPCVDVEIDNKQFSMELDLGFRGDLSVEEDHIDLIPEKSFILEKLMHGVKGKQYPTKVYSIPKAKIGKMTFLKPRVEEDSHDFIKDSTFVADGSSPSSREKGRLGWKLFYKVNLLIDMKNEHIAFCDNLKTLEKQGYPVKNFTKTSLLLNNGLVEIIANTSEGNMHCMLDTGATWNILNREIEGEKPLEMAVWEPENISECSYFKINNTNFGPLSFHRMPIKLPFHIDAILGVEFFKENLVFLDFVNGCAYFAKNDAL